VIPVSVQQKRLDHAIIQRKMNFRFQDVNHRGT